MRDRHRSVEDLFAAALSRPPHDRNVFLDRACADAPELRRRIEQLLQADQKAGSFLRHPLLPLDGGSTRTGGSAAASEPGFTEEVPEAPPFKPGTIAAGRFTVQRFIARGGMGEVYEAWDSELKERVAIKTVRTDLGTSPDHRRGLHA